MLGPLRHCSLLTVLAALRPCLAVLVAQRKIALLASLSELNRRPAPATRDNVLISVAELEACECTGGSPEGRWSLIFSTQASAPDPRQVSDANFLQPLIDATYATFFKVAPQLAGAQEDGGRGAANEQNLSLETGLVANRVRIPLPAPWRGRALEIFVDGEVEAIGEDGRDDVLSVAFTECRFQLAATAERSAGGGAADNLSLRVPLPRPVGSLRTTFCDEEIRVSRGGRGGVFVLRRMRDEKVPEKVPT